MDPIQCSLGIEFARLLKSHYSNTTKRAHTQPTALTPRPTLERRIRTQIGNTLIDLGQRVKPATLSVTVPE